MRGMALVNAATLVAELGDLSRFANPRQLMAYLGLVPSEHSLGASCRVWRHVVARTGQIRRAWSWSVPGSGRTFPAVCTRRPGREGHPLDIGNTSQSRRCI